MTGFDFAVSFDILIYTQNLKRSWHFYLNKFLKFNLRCFWTFCTNKKTYLQNMINFLPHSQQVWVMTMYTYIFVIPEKNMTNLWQQKHISKRVWNTKFVKAILFVTCFVHFQQINQPWLERLFSSVVWRCCYF